MSPWLQLVLALAPGSVAAWFAYRASTRTSQVQAQAQKSVAELSAATERTRLDLERQKMAEDAAKEAKATYAALIKDLRDELDRMHRQIERLQAQQDRTLEQLAREQGVSHKLREQLSAQSREVERLRGQVEALEGLVQRLRRHPGVGPTAESGPV